MSATLTTGRVGQTDFACYNVFLVQTSSSFADATDAVLTVSRVLVAVAAQSLAGADADVTLPQYRALVVMCARGPQSMGALSEELGVLSVGRHPSL